MGVGLAHGHLSPGALLEEHLHKRLDRSLEVFVRRVSEQLKALVVVFTDVVGPALEVGERVAVGGEREAHPFEIADPLE